MTTFIFGHKNPDTDSVCSSIALSYLKNEQGGKTIPKVLGNINNETKFVLNYFNIPVPSYLNDVRVRIKNIKYDKKAYIFEEESINDAFKVMQKQNLTAIPLIDDKKKLTGYVTLKEIAKYLISGNKEIVNTTMDNIIETLDAKVIVKCDDLISGDILIAGLQSKTIESTFNLSSRDILVVGDRYKVLNFAIDSKVKLIILPLNVNVDKKIIKKAEKNKVNIIASEYDSFQIANKILLSNFIKSINLNRNPVTVNNEDYYTDFKNMAHRVNHSNYPVVNNKGECLGLIKLTGPNDYEKQKVILIDHNNFAQSVDGLDEADILEIIDHHNLGAMGTSLPINFRSKPVGCTSTMIYEMYKEAKVTIPRDMAGLMLSAILSDTLLLTSPTTTEDDRFAAVKLASIAKVDIDKYGIEMLKAASSIEGKTVEELIKTDFKSYVVGDKLLGISQVMTMDIDAIENNKEKYIAKLNEMVSLNYTIVTIFITDIIRNGSYVLYNDAAANIIKDSFGLKSIHQGMFLPKIVSRKKQIQPNIISILEGD
ncbi:MAG: putative manganese-dependent inorganic diphosphatase [Bacilli bacterium]